MKKQEIKIGISLFPDLLLLYYADHLGYFSGDKNYTYIIKIVDWNNIFNLLMDEKLDFVIANREICSDENKTRELFEFLYPLIEYKGFSIIFKQGSNIKNYHEVLSTLQDPDKEDRALRDTLMQLKKEPKTKIFASENTDHYSALIEILNLVGLSLSDVIIESNGDPYHGYELFMDESQGLEAIVGALPQRLLAIQKKGIELINQNDCNLPFSQVNGLICKKLRVKELEKGTDKILHV